VLEVQDNVNNLALRAFDSTLKKGHRLAGDTAIESSWGSAF